MDNFSGYDFSSAISDFRKARRKAAMQDIVARLIGTNTELLSYEDVRRSLKGRVSSKKILKEVPINSIIGSVNRYDDFTRDFLPRETVKPERWAKVELGTFDLAGLPPIEVYQIGETFFVIDGNHRVSVAKNQGAKFIQAYVTQVETRVPVNPDIKIEELIIKREYADFLEKTDLDKHRQGVDLTASYPGAYRKIEQHIAVHRYYMGIEQEREIPYEEAASQWFDRVYMPVINIIRNKDLLSEFPQRTETDLYVWIVEHRKALEEEYGDVIQTGEAANDFSTQFSPKISQKLTRFGERIIDKYIPDVLDAGVRPGAWREERKLSSNNDRLLNDILVPVNGTESGWVALEQGLMIAEKEDAIIGGLTIVKSEEDKNSLQTLQLKNDFLSRCSNSGINAYFNISTGRVAKRICDQSRWYDLTVFNLAHPPGYRTLDKLSSGVRYLVQQCPTLLMAVPTQAYPLEHVLLAYDDSDRAREALYISTYFAGKWNLSLTVITVRESKAKSKDVRTYAKNYLEMSGIQAKYIDADGNVPESILKTAEQQRCQAIIMGSYSTRPIIGIFTESVIDQILRKSRIPVLLCR